MGVSYFSSLRCSLNASCEFHLDRTGSYMSEKTEEEVNFFNAKEKTRVQL
jgi:hypothetical protein